MSTPKAGADLQQFIYSIHWIRSSILDCSPAISPLAKFVKTVYKMAAKRTLLPVAGISLKSHHCDQEHIRAFLACKQAFKCKVTFSHVDKSEQLCINTDATEFLCAGVVAQIPIGDMSLQCVMSDLCSLWKLSLHRDVMV